MTGSPILRWLLAGVCLMAMLSVPASGFAQKDSGKSRSKSAARSKSGKSSKKTKQNLGPAVQHYATNNFVVYTDLPKEEAEELMDRLETMLKLISTYWARPNARVIEMYVVKDVNAWPQGSIPAEGLDHITAGGGITVSQASGIVNRVTGQSVITKAESVVYAIADRGTPQHEAVHAYCAQTFGRTGPTWYSEGMAEMGQYWKDKDASVNCYEVVVEYLKSEEPKELTEITAPGQRTGDDWRNYAWRWALCHLLANNANYAPRFRPLGLALLNDQEASFERVYGPMDKEITFEYLFFLKHFDRGYRVDLCSWDWKTKFNALRGTSSVQAKLDAGHGWQASRLSVKAGTKYTFTTTGTWKVAKDGDDLTAAGNAEGNGKLVGILFDDYELSEPFDLGESGEWTAPQDGTLYLRCHDDWCDLADNKGSVTVKWKLAE